MNRNGDIGVITPGTYVRSLRFSVLRRLSDFLDPQDGWREVAVSIRRAGGEPRYSQQHVRRFEALAAQGRSPTIELLNDWGTTNCTVGDLVDILKSHWLLAAASLLLPESTPAETQQSPPVMKTEPNNSSVPTTLLQDTKDVSSSAPIPTEDPREDREPESTGFLSFSYLELEEITGKFDDRPTLEGGSRLGEGGFGVVYKGVVDGKPVAVKKLSPEEDFLAEDLRVQFHQEIQTLKTLKHMNLVDMVGFSCDGQFPCLVYAYMPHGSLLDRLACLDETPPLLWQSRCFIAAGSARGLQFLHNNHHVHRDVKSGNILLDENFVPKVSDFGLTRASAKHSSTTMMTERIVGTRAYMAPEALRGEITPKSDIYSFGVVLLEILSGLPPVDENREPEFLMELRYNIDDEDEELTLEDVLDKKMKEVDVVQAERMYASACNCLQDRKVKRPSIHQVLSELEEVARSFFPGCQPQESEA